MVSPTAIDPEDFGLSSAHVALQNEAVRRAQLSAQVIKMSAQEH